MGISTGCVFLMSVTPLVNVLSSMTAGYGLIQWAQLLGLIVGMIASAYVIHNQRLTTKWKKQGGSTLAVDKKQNKALEEVNQTIAELTEEIKKLKQNG